MLALIVRGMTNNTNAPRWRNDPRPVAEQIAYYREQENRIMDELCFGSYNKAEATNLRNRLTTARYRLSVLLDEQANAE